MYTLREIRKNLVGEISNIELGNHYLMVEKIVDENGKINSPFLDAYKDCFGEDYENDRRHVRAIIEYTSPKDGDIWHQVLTDYNDYYIMSDTGKTFESIRAINNGISIANEGTLNGAITVKNVISSDKVNLKSKNK